MAVATATILSAGQAVPTAYRLVSIDVHTEVNRIPSADIRFLDGNRFNQYAVSDGKHFEPGVAIEIKIRREGGSDASIFKGLVVKQTLEWTSDGSVLTVRVKDAAIKLMGKRQSIVHVGKTDDEIIKDLIGAVNVRAGQIASTSIRHRSMVQYDCTAWDFICMRAEAIGMLVTVEAGALSMQAMTKTNSKKHSYTWGTGMYEFEVEAAAEHPYAEVQSVAWDPSRNGLTDPPIDASTAAKIPGNLAVNSLAGAVGRDKCLLKHPVPSIDGELRAWANARLSRSVLATLRGRISIPGDATIKLLDKLDVDGVGDRFSGSAAITGVRHRYDVSGWRTELQFGLSPEQHAQREDVAEIPAMGLLPPVRGLQIGVVTAFEEDPDGELRVKVVLPGIDDKTSGAVWARLLTLDGGTDHGLYFRPEEGDEVVVGFLFDDPRHPVVLGSLFGAKNGIPAGFASPSAPNEEKGIITKKGTTIKFVDAEKPALFIKTSGGNSIVIDEAAQGIKLTDQHGHAIEMNAQGITIDAGSGNVTIKGSKVDVQ